MNADFEFRDGQLIPVQDPLTWEEGKSGDEALAAYGFESCGDRIGEEFGLNVQLHGPGKKDREFEWAVCVTLNEHWRMVWCRTFIELQGYLVSIAPLLTAVSVAGIEWAVRDAHEWLFGQGRGLFSDHVSDRLMYERQEARNYKANRKCDKTA